MHVTVVVAQGGKDGVNPEDLFDGSDEGNGPPNILDQWFFAVGLLKKYFYFFDLGRVDVDFDGVVGTFVGDGKSDVLGSFFGDKCFKLRQDSVGVL